MSNEKRPLGIWLMSAIAVLFGVLTIKSGGSVLFIGGEAREQAGNYVPFVLWFNFLAGFAYVIAGVGLFRQATWAPKLAAAIAVLTLLVFGAFGMYVINGGLHEQRTVGAMTVRSVLWVIIAFASFRTVRRGMAHQPA